MPRPPRRPSPELPAAWVERVRADLGDDEAAELVAALAAAPARALRANPAKVGVAELAGRLGLPLDPVAWCPSATHLPGGVQPGAAVEVAAGLGYLQEPSALAVVEALGIRPGDRVADLAASPGGKATHALSALGPDGLLVANEAAGGRIGALVGNLERWGTQAAVVTSAPVADLAGRAAGAFDRVILDAPCSGEAMWRKDPASVRTWSPAAVAGNARRQADLLDHAARLVAPGGRLAYSTCTFGGEEDEEQVGRFLDGHPEWVPVDLGALPGASPALGGGIGARWWPQRVRGDGHFVAVLARGGEAEEPGRVRGPAGRPPSPAVLDQLDRLDLRAVDDLPREALVVAGEVVRLPPRRAVPDLPGIRRDGLPVARLARGRVEPTHALALATLRPDPADAEVLDPADLEAFRRGVPLERPGRPGWRLVCLERWPVGWAYRSGGVLKPRLPRHERRP